MRPAFPSVVAASFCACGAWGCASLIGADFEGLHGASGPVAPGGSDGSVQDAPVGGDGPMPVNDSAADIRADDDVLDADTDDAPDAAPPLTKTVFLSSVFYTGDLGGLLGADAKCQSLAMTAGLSGTFRAWLSDDATSAATRLTHATVPYALVDGTIVANSWAELVSNQLAHAINKTETNVSPTQTVTSCGSFAGVWTGTGGTGSSQVGLTCSGWITTPPVNAATLGDAEETSSLWTSKCTGSTSSPCARAAALYCFEQ